MIIGSQYALKNLTTTLKYFRSNLYGREGRRLKQKFPDKYQKVSRINTKGGFDLSQPGLTFPINVPLKIKYVYKPKKLLYVDNNKDIQWDRLFGNEILLAFEELSSLTSTEVILGLERLAIQPGQEEHNWNEHPWITAAFQHILDNQTLYKKSWTLRFYKLMKKLNNTNPEMWKFIYRRIEDEIFTMNNGDFIYFWEKYHNDKTHFSAEFVEGLFKLMEARIRNFSTESIIKAMYIMEEHGRINHFYTHNVFLSLFKAPEHKFTAPQTVEILKILMLYNIEKFDRFYEQFYPKLLTVRCQSHLEAKQLKETLIQMQDIFQGHIIRPYIQYFETKQKELRNKPKIVTEKQLYERVRDDIHYFKQKLKMQAQNK